MVDIIKSINPDKIYGEYLGLLETIKCLESPYYYATKYLKIKDNLGNENNFTTRLSEKEFNKLFNGN